MGSVGSMEGHVSLGIGSIGICCGIGTVIFSYQPGARRFGSSRKMLWYSSTSVEFLQGGDRGHARRRHRA